MPTATERWDAFLQQIEARAKQAREEGAAEVRAASASLAGADAAAVSQVWSKHESRLQELERRIQDTWDEKVEAAFEAEDADGETRMAALEKGRLLMFQLEIAREELEPQLNAELAHLLFKRALESKRAGFCTACGQARVVPITFRQIEVRCPSCGDTSMFEPGELLRGAAAVGAHSLAQVSAHAEWIGMKLAERAVRQMRPPVSLALLKAWEQAQILYWFKYVMARGQIEPEMLRDPPKEVRDRMHQWYQYTAEHEQEWVRAGRPRDNF
jgi:hypothetical protein